MKGAWRIGIFLALAWAGGTVPLASARIIDGVVAVVGDEPVTFSEVRDAVAEGLGIPTGDADLYLREEKEPRRIVAWIETLVESALVRKELAKTGQAISEEEISRAVESVRKTNRMSEAEFSEALAREGITLDGYRKRLRWQMERGGIVRAKKFKDVAVTDEEVKAYFRENAERFLDGGEIRLAILHLPFPPDEKTGDRNVRIRIAGQQAGEYIRAGRTFSEAADLLRTSVPGASFVAPDFVGTGDLMPEIRKEVRKLKTGEVSAPFFNDSGGYLVKVLERRGGTLPDFAAVRDTLSEELADRRSEKAYADILAELKGAASVDIRL